MINKQRMIDSRLVAEYQSGSVQALPLLVKRWHKPFCNKAFWLVKDADVAKDIAQDSWKVIIAKINHLKDPGSFGSWALRIVYTKSIDWIKANTREREQLMTYQKENTSDDDEIDENIELKKMLLKSIKGLPEHQQIAIRLFYVEEYSLKEIAELLNISVGTAKSRLFHAREKLKETLKR